MSSQTITPADIPAGVSAPRRRVVLAIVLSAAFMAVLDVTIVNVTIPTLRADLNASYGQVELVISAYTLSYASLLVIGGRLGDIFGHDRMFIAGIAVFVVASACCGLAPTIWILIAARTVQGVGAAMLYPQVLAIIQLTFEGEQRGRALGIFGASVGLGAISGQLVGGLLLAADVGGLGWRPAFLVNVVIGLIPLLAARFALPARGPRQQTHLDWGGAALLTTALVLAMVPLLVGHDVGWPLWTGACLAAAVPAAGAFVRHERRVAARGGAPLVRMDLFRNRGFAVGVQISALFAASYAGFLLLLAVHLQIGLGLSALHAALVYTPAATGFFITALTAPRLARALGRHVLSLGYIIAALGLLGTAATAVTAGADLSGWELAPTLFIAGLGQGLGMTPLIGTIVGTLRPAEAGAGAGVVTTTLQAGNVLGIAVVGMLFFGSVGPDDGPQHYATVFAYVMAVSAALLLASAGLVARLPWSPSQSANALLERVPDRASGFAYSMYLMTGGRLGDRLLRDILGHVVERRVQRTEHAPSAPGEFLAYHFAEAGQDRAWLTYLMREALTYGEGEVPHEAQRLPVIQAQVDEVRARQGTGDFSDELDPAMLRLMGFALANYPRLLPQITRMTTGHAPGTPAFAEAWERFLLSLGGRLRTPPEAAAPAPAPAAAPHD